MVHAKPLFAFLALCAASTGLSCRCSRKQPERPAATLTEKTLALKNGLDVDLVAGPCGDHVAVAVLVAGGVDHDPPEQSGMAQVAARVLAEIALPTPIDRSVETGTDYVLYSTVVPVPQLEPAIQDVAAWMSRVTPGEADLERARSEVLAEIGKLSGADATLTAMSLAEEAVSATRGNGKRLGVGSEVKAITLDDLRAFWEQRFKPGNARIAVAGPFDADKARGWIEAAFSPIGSGTPPVLRQAASASVRGTLVMGDAPSAVAVAVAAPSISDPLYPAFLSLAGRLVAGASKERAWQASYDPIARPELLFITASIPKGEPPEPAAARIRAEIGKVLEQPPAPDESAKTGKAFRLLVDSALDPSLCAKDARAFAVARIRKAEMHVNGDSIAKGLDTVSPAYLGRAPERFAPTKSAAVIAGGAIR
jgi:zinc protease